MNWKLKIALIRRSSEQGFAMPVALGMGLVMMLVGATMIVRSQSDQVTAISQTQTARSLQVAEAGVTKVQAFLNKYRILATQPHNITVNGTLKQWTSYLTSLHGSCLGNNPYYTELDTFNDWQTVGSGTDRFKIISYTPPSGSTGEGTLVLDAQVRQNTTEIATTRLKVTIPVKRELMPQFSPPGAWAEDYGLGNNQIIADTVIDASCNGSLDPGERDNIRNSAGGAATIIQNPLLGLGNALSVPANATNIAAITGNLTLPRPNDISAGPNNSSNGEYIYSVGTSGGDSIRLSGNNKLVIRPGYKVTLYLQGNLSTQGGSTKIGHNCYDTDNPPDGEENSGVTTPVSGCLPTNFQIMGGTNTTSIVFGGSNIVDAFIFAPKAIQSGVNGGAQVRGSVWVKQWDRANGNHTVIVQTGGWNAIPEALRPPNIASSSSWQRQEIP